jgi:hypothetical protein
MKNVTHHVHSTAGVSVCYVCEGAEIKARTQAGSVLVKKARPQSLHPCVHTLCMCVCVHVCACVCMRLCVYVRVKLKRQNFTYACTRLL